MCRNIDEDCFDSIDDEDDVLGESSKNSFNINEDGSEFEFDDETDSISSESQSEEESENDVERFDEGLDETLKKLCKNLLLIFPSFLNDNYSNLVLYNIFLYKRAGISLKCLILLLFSV